MSTLRDPYKRFAQKKEAQSDDIGQTISKVTAIKELVAERHGADWQFLMNMSDAEGYRYLFSRQVDEEIFDDTDDLGNPAGQTRGYDEEYILVDENGDILSRPESRYMQEKISQVPVYTDDEEYGGRNQWHPGDKAYYEYHCYEGHDSNDAQAWYHSHQIVTVLGEEEGCGYEETRKTCPTMRDRGEAGMPITYKVRWDDGFEYSVFEDELLTDSKFYERPDQPAPRTAQTSLKLPAGYEDLADRVAIYKARVGGLQFGDHSRAESNSAIWVITVDGEDFWRVIGPQGKAFMQSGSWDVEPEKGAFNAGFKGGVSGLSTRAEAFEKALKRVREHLG